MQLSAPGGVADLTTAQQRADWSAHLSREIDAAITGIGACTATSQYVNPAVVDVSGFQRAPIHWPGFPKLLYAHFPTKQGAYTAADAPSVVTHGKLSGGRTVQDEYLEWYIHRDAEGKITAVDFTTETQEYWSFLYSEDKDLAASTYSAVLGQHITAADISDASGAKYNPYNKFNTTLGIVHLIQPNNTLPAELDIAVQSTLPRTDATGAVTNDVVSCIHCDSPDPAHDALGEAGRNSDPTIAQMVSAVAATGCQLTIPDPVGLYIEGIDLSGWTGPAGVDVSNCWTVLRGAPTVRARFQVPAGSTLSDFAIAGVPLQYAGQIAERISVFLTAAYGPGDAVPLPATRPCSGAAAARGAGKLALKRRALPK